MFTLLLIDTALLFFFFIYTCRTSNIFNPAFVYLFFHGYAFTLRGWAVNFGSPTMYQDSNFFRVITHEEIFRGLLFADIALVLFFTGIFFSSKKIIYSGSVVKNVPKTFKSFKFNGNVVFIVTAIFLPIAIFSFLTSKFSQVDELSSSGYINISKLWIPGILALFT